MTTIVRRASVDDTALLARIAAATFPLACPPHTRAEDIAEFIATVLSEARFSDYLADPQRALFVSETEGVPSGYTMLIVGDPSDPDVAAAVSTRPTAELSKVYVLPELHGGGIAAALVEATVAEARARGARSVWLGVNQLNVRANRFYEKAGFAQVGTKRFLVGERYEDDFVRALELGAKRAGARSEARWS